ncbi:exported hypothetical protein [Vibrio nigripulchritudo SOn1]|uniref:Secreted protein n=1 Tax=Vibrio nigripulchritudo SOn1 TaxID=1238450 RepID=A0AAV2VW52_9VIBR|nr:hypothetical protein [Vibrio nigripulchritudo]CCO48833.1 exported hypothetical protein [Vibrio nigripulchritudo SOn1]
MSNYALKTTLAASIILSLGVNAGESNIDSSAFESQILYPSYEKELNSGFIETENLDSIDSISGSTGWSAMNGNGTDWYGTNGGITKLYGAGGDRSVEQYYSRSYGEVPWYWATTATVHVQMDGQGSGNYRCPSNHIVTELYYYDGGDDSIEAFRCRAMRSHSTYSESSLIFIPYSGTASCPSGKYITGLRYKDTGDDYVEAILCSSVR